MCVRVLCCSDRRDLLEHSKKRMVSCMELAGGFAPRSVLFSFFLEHAYVGAAISVTVRRAHLADSGTQRDSISRVAAETQQLLESTYGSGAILRFRTGALRCCRCVAPGKTVPSARSSKETSPSLARPVQHACLAGVSRDEVDDRNLAENNVCGRRAARSTAPRAEVVCPWLPAPRKWLRLLFSRLADSV